MIRKNHLFQSEQLEDRRLLAAEGSFDAYSSNPTELNEALEAARTAKADGPFTIGVTKSFGYKGTFFVGDNVAIKGVGDAKTRPTITNSDNAGSLFQFNGSNSSLSNVNLSTEGTGYQNRHVDVKGTAKNTSIKGSSFRNGYAAVYNKGDSPQGLEVTGNFMQGQNRAVSVSRNLEAGGSLDGGKLTINDNVIENVTMGVSVDNGNDGSTYPATDFNRSSDEPTRYKDGSTISGNMVNGVKQFGVALARVDNVSVSDNKVSMATKNEGARNFGYGIHLENRTRNSDVTGNRIQTAHSGQAGISLETFTDHGIKERQLADGVSDSRVSGNTVDKRAGTQGGYAVFANGAKNVTITDNKFQGVAGSGAKKSGVYSFTVEGAKNDFTANSGNQGLPDGKVDPASVDKPPTLNPGGIVRPEAEARARDAVKAQVADKTQAEPAPAG